MKHTHIDIVLNVLPGKISFGLFQKSSHGCFGRYNAEITPFDKTPFLADESGIGAFTSIKSRQALRVY